MVVYLVIATNLLIGSRTLRRLAKVFLNGDCLPDDFRAARHLGAMNLQIQSV